MEIVVLASLLASLVLATTEATQARVRYFIFKEECYDRFLAFDLEPECVKFTVSKGLGYAIILGSTILKVPQILKIMASRSVDGIAAFSYYVEVIGYLGTIGNSRRQGLSFSVYGEGVFIEFQNFLIIMLIWNYNKSIFMLEKLFFCCLTFAYAFLLFEGSLMTPEIWDMIASSGIVLVLLQRIPQIIQTWRQ